MPPDAMLGVRGLKPSRAILAVFYVPAGPNMVTAHDYWINTLVQIATDDIDRTAIWHAAILSQDAAQANFAIWAAIRLQEITDKQSKPN